MIYFAMYNTQSVLGKCASLCFMHEIYLAISSTKQKYMYFTILHTIIVIHNRNCVANVRTMITNNRVKSLDRKQNAFKAGIQANRI